MGKLEHSLQGTKHGAENRRMLLWRENAWDLNRFLVNSNCPALGLAPVGVPHLKAKVPQDNSTWQISSSPLRSTAAPRRSPAPLQRRWAIADSPQSLARSRCSRPPLSAPRPQVLKSWACYFFPFLWLTFTFSGPFSWLYHLVEYYSIFWLSISQLDPMTASKFHLTLEDWLLGQRDHQIVRSRLEQQPVFSLLSLS